MIIVKIIGATAKNMPENCVADMFSSAKILASQYHPTNCSQKTLNNLLWPDYSDWLMYSN